MSYGLWVAAGVVLAFAATRLQPPDRSDLNNVQRQRVLLAAVIGAVLGAFLFELPADVLGWARRPEGVPADLLPLGGRTVLGGLLGGWLLVEVVKRRIGVSGATGDRFALPLAIALSFGRMGCASAGCCGGIACDAWWAWHGQVPVQFIEMLFHASAAGLLALAVWQQWGSGRRLAIYLTLYAILRFTLETWRGNPPVALGLTWYQFLAIALGMLAGGTWWHRQRNVLTALSQSA
jgi:phosphatidylglycerol---prolipoprotein diacylglyceryl transferase